ncbi:MAG: ATP synthase F1 subunit epsilon, partial [Firmicutes bacterium]|nr:ATP synthase F1 subunit epsilon [Bacillota bacterium]
NMLFVTVNTREGEIGILPHHTNLMSQLAPGEMRIKNGDKERVMAIGSGLLEVTNNILIIATDLAESLEDIDEKVAEEARKRAEAALEQTQTDEEYATAMANLEKALAQLKVKRRHQRSPQ